MIDPWRDLKHDLAAVLNRHNLDTDLRTPDYLLADALVEMLTTIAVLNDARAAWHQRTGGADVA